MKKSKIELQNISKSYYSEAAVTQALRKVSLTFVHGEFVAITGESGSGKSTLLNIIGGMDSFDEGEMIVNGKPTFQYTEEDWEAYRRNQIGYVFQDYSLIGHYTALDNITGALLIMGKDKEEAQATAMEYLKKVGLEGYEKHPATELSSGQKQRLSIARALAKNTGIIIADEPTGNLDEENTIRTMTILKKISKECLVLLVTHEKRIAKFFGDRIIEICDGKVVRDENNTASTYERSDDSNIYLKEFEPDNIENGYSRFNIYYKKHEAPPSINMNMVWKDGKLYIQNLSDYDIIFEGEENGIQILDTERPSLEMEEIENLSYDLERLPDKGNAKLPFHEIWRIAMSNIRLMGKKQIFITIILIAAAVMLSITAAKFTNMVSISEEKIVSTDSHYARIDFNNISVFDHSDHLKVLQFAWKYLDGNDYGYTFFVPDGKVSIIGEGFEQIKNLKQVVYNTSYVPLDFLKKEDIVYGKMPELRNEVVLDLQVVKNLIASKGVVTTNFKTPENFIGATLKTPRYKVEMTITGISDTHEPALYCGQNILLGFPQKGYKIASLDELKKEYPGKYDDASLADNEILIRDGLYDSLKLEKDTEYRIGDDYKNIYNITGTFTDDIGVDYVLSDRGCLNIRDLMVFELKTCMVYSDNPKSAINKLKGIKDKSMNVFKMSLTIPHDDEIKAYREANTGDVDASSLVTIAIVVISIIMVYFTIKSNAISRSEELTVYSLLGISKGSILKSYIIEMVLLTSYTSLPSVLVTSGVIKFIGSIPSLGITMLFPWWAVLLLIIVIYTAHAIISILPVYGILSKPPATLAVKG